MEYNSLILYKESKDMTKKLCLIWKNMPKELCNMTGSAQNNPIGNQKNLGTQDMTGGSHI